MLDNLKNPIALLGRILLALIFVISGFGKLADIGGTAGYIASSGLPLASALAVGAGLLELLAALALIIGWQARWAALALAAFTLLASLLFHAFWSMPEAQQYMQKLMFMKNIAIVGGLLMIAALGAGGIGFDRDRPARD